MIGILLVMAHVGLSAALTYAVLSTVNLPQARRGPVARWVHVLLEAKQRKADQQVNRYRDALSRAACTKSTKVTVN